MIIDSTRERIKLELINPSRIKITRGRNAINPNMIIGDPD